MKFNAEVLCMDISELDPSKVNIRSVYGELTPDRENTTSGWLNSRSRTNPRSNNAIRRSSTAPCKPGSTGVLR